MSKIIWKDIDSSTIKGLLICELPPITKPKMRVQETAIDGVDGSIIEELGYETYDKSIRIGLTRGFDIDEVIKYFSGEGNVVFSNEPNKYYKAKIIEQIDYTRLLRFKEAEVKFRVQPFKYEYQEEEQVAETGSVEGIEVKITDAKATEIKIDGRSTQDGTPTPTTPVEIKSIGYENLFQIAETQTINSVTLTKNNNGTFNLNGTATEKSEFSIYVPINESGIANNEIYTLSKASNYNFRVQVAFYNGSTWVRTPLNLAPGSPLYVTNTINLSNITQVRFLITVEKGTSINLSNVKVQLEKGSIAHSYGPYGKYGVEVKTVGKNLLNPTMTSETKNGVTATYDENTQTITLNGTCNTDNTTFNLLNSLKIPKGKTAYVLIKYVSGSSRGYLRLGLFDSEWHTYNQLVAVTTTGVNSDISGRYTTTEETIYTNNALRCNSDSVFNNLQIKVYVSYIDERYEPYQENVLTVALNEPLRSVGDVKDIAYIRNNKLYVDRYIGSLILNGSEEWSKNTITVEGVTYSQYFISISGVGSSIGISTHFQYSNGGAINDNTFYINSSHTLMVFPRPKMSNDYIETLDDFKTWLSTHNTQVDYELLTPVTEELGDLTILDLLDGENNISNSADTNMIIDYIETLTINNSGNYVSKPTLEIEGAGTIRFMLNGNLVFSYNFDDDGSVVIDSEKEDAYLGSVLKNRNMNGEFPKLEIGENKITWDGIVKNIKAVKKSRWL